MYIYWYSRCKKILNIFLEWGHEKVFFRLITWNLPQKSLMKLKASKNDLLMVFFLTIFTKKVSFSGSIRPSKNSEVYCCTYLIKTLYSSTHITIFGVINFLIKKWQNWSNRKNVVNIVLIIFGLDAYSESWKFLVFLGGVLLKD